MPHAARVAACPDDGDRARPQDRRDAGDFRHRLPLITRRAVRRRRPQIDVDLERSRAVAPAAAQARRCEQLKHRRVLRPDLGGERQDPLRPGVFRQALEQQGRDAVTLVGVGDDETDLGRRRAGAVIARQPDHLARHDRDKRHPGVVVHLAEARGRGQAEGRLVQEHMLVQRAGRCGTVQPDQRGRVRPPDRADHGRLTISEQPVELPRGRISGRHCLVVCGRIRSNHRYRLRHNRGHAVSVSPETEVPRCPPARATRPLPAGPSP